MSLRVMASTTIRILRQLRHDPRTLVLMNALPIILLTLLYFMFDDNEQAFDNVALIMLGVFPFFVMMLITSITMLRERSSGTLERLFTTPVGKLDLLFGYGIAFGIVAAIQTTLAVIVTFGLLGLDTAGSFWLVILTSIGTALLGVALGLLASAFARTEFQAVQFMPVVALPQILLCGLFVARDEMASWLQALSKIMPLTYAVEALQEIMRHPSSTSTMWRDLVIIFAVVIGALVLGGATLRRRTP